jgi:hypothetical protein
MEKERKDNKELTHVLTTKYDILKKNWSVLFAKLEHSVFIVIRWSIFLYRDQLYIFH